MIQISEPEESESFSRNNPIIHYRFNRKFDFLNCHSQLYISNSKLKIIINCNEEYSKEIKTYTNSFSLYDLQNISKYFKFFNKIEDVLEDIATVFNQCNYEIEKSGNKLNILLHLDINEELLDIKLQLNLVKNLQDNKNKNKKVIYYNPKRTEETEAYKVTKHSGHNVGVKSMNDLNNILTDLKDRLTVLEVTQNTSNNNNNQTGSFMNKNIRNRNIGYNNALNIGSKSLGGNYNENILLSMESIMKRIIKLEETSQMKSNKINELKEKLKIYEPTITATSENDSINDNNTFKFNNNNYNNYNNIDYNNMNNQNQKYINLGSIRNVDTSTITSNNSNMNKELLKIKEEELNNSFSNKKKQKKKNEKNSSDEESIKQIEDNNFKKTKNKIKGKGKIKKRKNRSLDKLRKDDDNDELKKPQNKKISKNKSVDKGINNFNNIKEEIINTDIIKEKKKSNLKKSLSNVNANINDNDSQKMINNLEKNLIQKKKKNSSIIKSKNSTQFENNDYINNNNNYNKKRSTLNKDNNDDDNDININNLNINNEEVKNSLKENDNFNKINTIYNSDNKEENNNNNNNPIFKFSHTINDNIENNININNQIAQNNNSSSQQNSNENNLDSSKEKEEKIAKYLEKKKELELEREIEEKEERKRRQKTFMDTSSQESSLKVKQIHKSLTMAPKEDLRLYCKSRIIFTKKELKLLKNKINQDKKKYCVFFDVLYRASEDGADTDFVKKIMEKQKKTLTLFQTEKGARFGIFVEKKLDTSILMTQYLSERTGTCFLVSLNNLEVYDIYKKFTSSENKLCFIKNKKKNKNGSSYAIYTPPKDFLKKQCYMGDLTEFFTVDGNEDIIGEKEEYTLKEVEVCKVSIEKRSNEKLKNEILKAKTEIPKKKKEDDNKHSYGREYSFKNKENSSDYDEEQEINENNNKKIYNQEDEEKISNKLKYDYYDWGIINGKNDKK